MWGNSQNNIEGGRVDMQIGGWAGGKSRIDVYWRSGFETMDLNVTASLMQTPEEYYGYGGN